MRKQNDRRELTFLNNKSTNNYEYKTFERNYLSDYLNLMSSSELVDMQIEGFDYYHTAYENLNKRKL